MPSILELHGIVKHFPGILANDRIDLAVQQGEIRAIVGENGAGKTTLMRVLYGLYRPDDGEIMLRGQRKVFRSPHDAICAGIGMVHQHFMLFPSLSVAENVVYGAEITRYGLLDRQAALNEVAALSEDYGLQIEPRARVEQLPVGVRQRVEILKTLYRQADLLILDEPTAVLTPQERNGLFTILKTLAQQGKTILFITHKLEEVVDISDGVTVLRNGKVTANLKTSETNVTEICRCMIGRDVPETLESPLSSLGEEVLTVERLCIENETGRREVDKVSFQIRAGEIVGIAGVAGNGQTALVQAITGLRSIAEGQIRLVGDDMVGTTVAHRRQAGLAYIPEDRSAVGLALDASIAENLLMGFQRQTNFSRLHVLSLKFIREHARHLIQEFAIKASRVQDVTAHLSGGNQQKVLAAREFSHHGQLLIAEQPTRGLDIGSAEFIHQQLLAYRNSGHGVLLVSAELHEILTLADRILVMFRGKIVGESAAADVTEERLGLLMTGSQSQV